MRVTFEATDAVGDCWIGTGVDVGRPTNVVVRGTVIVDGEWVFLGYPEAPARGKGYGATLYYAAALLGGELNDRS